MPNLLSRSKNVEFEWNLALQIRNQKERWSRRRAETEVEQWGAKFSYHCAKLLHHYAKISHYGMAPFDSGHKRGAGINNIYKHKFLLLP